MSLHTWLMLKPCVLTIWTTCSLKSVSNILLDFGLLTVHGISVFNNLSDCLFLSDHYTQIDAVDVVVLNGSYEGECQRWGRSSAIR